MKYKSITEEEVKLRILLGAEEPIQFKIKLEGYKHYKWNDMNDLFSHSLSTNLIKFDYKYRIKLGG
jgi:hypothetical protein